MMTIIIMIHVVVCIVLIGIVLIQRGRGSGLVESLSGVESVFGTKTSAFLTKSTTVLSIMFFVTCLSLAVLSVRQSKSLMRNVKEQPAQTEPAQTQPPQTQPAAQAKPETASSQPEAAPSQPETMPPQSDAGKPEGAPKPE
jgi:preprotein translocase subunit SecG